VPWYPGDWVWPVLGSLIVAALAAAVAILATTDNGSPTKTTAATGPPVPGATGTIEPPPPAGTNTSSLPTPTIPATTETTAPAPQPPPPAATELIEWPQGQNGWTIVLASIPQSSGRATATGEAREALGAGLTDVGVLNSSEFSGLHPGYFVVFTGTFTSQSEASAALDTATASYPQAYVRQIIQ
jgi:type IV secretory pathway VirB10-like protein